ncbi:MAG: PD-(D/E)XK nuclease family protein [Methanobrevibacter sp.]|jgi:CRISPR/Cas system-associated exonuclease Cas4 (RecB family)|nr:PD-(D/E)XK nuclease family protein [Methanobrevibacter sp.]
MERPIKFENNYEIINHPKVKGLQIVEGKENFPISWLNQQGYCEYSLYLEYIKGIVAGPTEAMVVGDKEHKKLEDKFITGAREKGIKPTELKDVLEISKEEKAISREVFVIAPEIGIRGYIDEIWLTPEEFVIIDDKPGNIPYNSTINQVLAYALAFQSMIDDDRPIKVALRERGTDNIFWSDEFDKHNQDKVKYLINRMLGLFDGLKPFIPTKNKNKCKKCRFQSYCPHFTD